MILALVSAGCTSQHQSNQSIVQSPAYAAAPRRVAEDVKRIVSAPPVSLPVEDQGNGQLLTGWQAFQGDWHIARYWHERTRYRITIVPDFNDPANRARIQVSDETEQRPDESGPNIEAKTWHPAPQVHRPERSEALLHQIEIQLQSPAAIAPARP